MQMCSPKILDIEPLLITAQGNHSEGRQIYLKVKKMYFKTTDIPGKMEVIQVMISQPSTWFISLFLHAL